MMKVASTTHRRILLWLLPLAVSTTLAAASEPFPGVRYEQRSLTEPRLAVVYIVEIDLSTPGLRFRTTEPNGPDLPGQTTLETTRAFVGRIGAQIGINANWFATSGNYATLSALSYSDGQEISPFAPTDNRQSINISSANVPAIFHDPASIPLWNAISGYRILRNGGTQQTQQDGSVNPRTAIGYTADNRLILLVVDGRSTVSEGMTTLEMVDIFIGLGVTDAINLDGGGSTTLVFADPTPRVVNRPSDTTFWGSPVERKVGNNLGVYYVATDTPVRLAFTSGTGDLPVGGTRVLTVEVRDEAGDRVDGDNGRAVTFSRTAGDGTVTGLGQAETVDGIASLTVTGQMSGAISILAIAEPP